MKRSFRRRQQPPREIEWRTAPQIADCIDVQAAAPKRTVVHGDALAWLDGFEPQASHAIVTSLPDVSELPSRDMGVWTEWFRDAAARCLSKLVEGNVAIFFQTDIKSEGRWIDKGFLVQTAAAQDPSVRLLWHKIVCRAPPGTTTFGRPAYAHMLCFTRELPMQMDRSTPDVIAAAGKTLWNRGMGLRACEVACKYVRDQTSCTTVLDPFCGVGTTLAVANALGLDAIGVELNKKRALRSEALVLLPEV